MTTAGTILVAGASGFIGRPLCAALADRGFPVRAMTRTPSSYRGAGCAVSGDVGDPASLGRALDGAEFAYYLVHSLDSADFEERDADAALNFGGAAAAAGVRQIIYLGGLGQDDGALSPHLRSRRQVEQLLHVAGVPVTVLRAAVIVGADSLSWEIIRQLVTQLPALIAPPWASTRTQPIAVADVLRYLVGVLDRPAAIGRVFEIGGPEVLTYLEMLKIAAREQGRSLPSVTLPAALRALTPSADWTARALGLITDVDTEAARHLIESMGNEVVVEDDSIQALVPGRLTTYPEAVRAALGASSSADAQASVTTSLPPPS